MPKKPQKINIEKLAKLLEVKRGIEQSRQDILNRTEFVIPKAGVDYFTEAEKKQWFSAISEYIDKLFIESSTEFFSEGTINDIKNLVFEEVKPLIKNGKDGKDGKDAVVDYEAIISKVVSELDLPDYEKLIEKTVKKIDAVEKKTETLATKKEVEDIKDEVKQVEIKLNERISLSGRVAGGGSNVTVKLNGALVGSGTILDFSGSGISSITHNGNTASINISGGGGGISDGDKGDITVSNSGATWTIDNLAVTNAKINDVAWSKVSGTPTTLAGYGITDAIDGSGTATYVPFFSDSNTLTTDSHFYYNSTTDVLHVHKLAGDATDGLLIESEGGTDVGILGAANTANVTWYGNHNFNNETANRIASFGASKTLTGLDTATYPDLTELSYVKGVTSSIQTQLNAKQASDAQLTDLAGLSYTGNALKVIRVNAGETGFELATVSGLSWGNSISGTTADGLTLTLSNSADDGASALKLVGSNTQANQSMLLNLDIGTSTNVAGMLIKGTGASVFGDAGTGRNHLTLWGNTSGNNTDVLAIGNGTSFTQTMGFGANGTLNLTPNNDSRALVLTIPNMSFSGSDLVRLVAGNTQTYVNTIQSINLGTSTNVQGLLISGTGSNTVGAVGTGKNHFSIWGNTANNNNRAISIGNGTSYTENLYITMRGRYVASSSLSDSALHSITSTALGDNGANLSEIIYAPSNDAQSNTYTNLLQVTQSSGRNMNTGIDVTMTNNSGNLTAVTGASENGLDVKVSRTNTGTTITDTAGSAGRFLRTNVTNTGAVYTVSSPVLAVEQVATQTAGTLTVSGDILKLTAPSDASFTGKLINALNNTTPVFTVDKDGNGAFAGDVTVSDEAYGAGWNGSLEVPTKNALYDKIETLGGGGNVSKVGTPADNQIGVWTGDGTIEGDSSLTWDGTSFNIATAKNFQIAGATILADAAGTTTLSNIDALDATTEATIESAIDTLANLTSIQGRTVTLADAGANAFFGWDDTAGAYENLSQAEARTILGLGTAAYVATDLADLNESTIESAIDTLPNLSSVAGTSGTIAFNGANITDLGDVTFKTGAQGGTLRTGTSAADKFVLQAYDVNDTTYRTVIELDAGNTVVLQLRANFLEIDDNTDTTKRVLWDISGATASTATTLDFNQSANRTVTFPDLTGTVALTGASQNVSFGSVTGSSILASSNDSGALGASGTAFSDLFLASGGVINWNAGNATLTHSAGLLTSNVDISVPDDAYDATAWNGSLEVPTKNAIRDKIESLGAFVWNEVTGTSQSASVNNGYICNNAALVTVTLPDTAAVGSVVRVAGSGAGGWKLAQNASETIRFGNTVTTTGTGGYLASSNQYDAVEVVCITANTTWAVISSVGNITIV